MKNKKTIWAIIIILIIVLGLFWFFGGSQKKDQSISVDGETLTKQTIVKELSTSGKLTGNQSQKLYGTGLVSEVKVNVGDHVTKDTVLVTYKTGEELKANIEGTITQLNVKKDEIDTSGQTGTPAVTIDDLSTLKVAIGLSKSEATEVKVDQIVKITSGDQEFDGKVQKIDPVATTIQTATGITTSLPAEVAFDTPPSGLFAGFDVDCKITVATAENVLALPIEALLYDKDNQPFVFAVKNNVAEKTKLSIGIQSDTFVEVTDGLKENDVVILSPDQNLQGKTVTVK